MIIFDLSNSNLISFMICLLNNSKENDLTMYRYCKYADETEVVFSNIMKNEHGKEIIHAHFERPTKDGC